MPDHKQTEGSVPSDTNYENFMKATNKSTVFILAFMKFLMAMNRKKRIRNTLHGFYTDNSLHES